MAELPVLSFWVDAFLADTQHLSCLESGAYLHLIFAAWRIPDGGLPDDDTALSRFARTTAREWRKVKPAVMAFWTFCADGKWRQKRLEREREKARSKGQKAAASAHARWLREKETWDANAMRTHPPSICESDARAMLPQPVSNKKDSLNQEWDGVKRVPPIPLFGPERKKAQTAADQDMVKHLMAHAGMTWVQANDEVLAARNGDLLKARDLERISRAHRLGWFMEDDAA